jgi:hypothetical protein
MAVSLMPASVEVVGPVNGHYYQIVDDAASWPEAKWTAEHMSITRDGRTLWGSLASIKSKEVNDIARSLYKGKDIWISAIQDVEAKNKWDAWKWWEGTSLTWNAWAPKQQAWTKPKGWMRTWAGAVGAADGTWVQRPLNYRTSFLVVYNWKK